MAKKKFAVTYTFGATILVEADDEDDAEATVENMPEDELLDRNCRDGFQVTGVEERED